MGDKAKQGDLLAEEIEHLRDELDVMACAASCRRVSRRCATTSMSCTQRARRRPARDRAEGRDRLMEALLLGIYAFFVWLIFIKFKWLPWNITSQVIVVIIPIVALTILVLTLNVVAPSSTKLRVFKYTIPIVSQVRGRVLEVPVEEGNRLVHKGDVLFRIDPDALPARCRQPRGATGDRAGRPARDRGIADRRQRPRLPNRARPSLRP